MLCSNATQMLSCHMSCTVMLYCKVFSSRQQLKKCVFILKLCSEACQASVWFLCHHHYCKTCSVVWNTQGDPGFMEELKMFIRTEVLKAVEGKTCFRISPMCFPTFCMLSLFFHIINVIFLSLPCREAIKHRHATRDTCRHVSVTIPWASRTSWQGWITRPTRRARTSWSSR